MKPKRRIHWNTRQTVLKQLELAEIVFKIFRSQIAFLVLPTITIRATSLSWTNRGARISSYQILMSIVVIVLVAEHFWAVQKSSTLKARLIFNRNHRIRSYCIVAKRNTTHLIVLPNRGGRYRPWTRQNPRSVNAPVMPQSHTQLRSLKESYGSNRNRPQKN